MGKSNYENINQRIWNHPLWHDYIDKVRKRANSWRVLRMDFNIRDINSEKGEYSVQPVFKFTFDGAVKEFSTYRNRREEIVGFEIELYDLMPIEEYSDIVRTIVKSKEIPTYGYSLDKVRDHRGRTLDKRYITQSFNDYLAVHYRELIGLELDRAINRCKAEMTALYDRDFEERKTASIERQGIDAIKLQLLKFRHLGNEALKTAFREFIVEDILSQ